MRFWMQNHLFPTSSLYKRIVLLIFSISIIFFVFLAIMIFSISNNYLEKVTLRCGERVARLVDRSLQTTMMSMDHKELVQTIAYICEIPGIRNISIYNSHGQLRHNGKSGLFHPDSSPPDKIVCYECHASIDTTQWIKKGVCVFDRELEQGRELVILAPVLNQPGCTSSNCHQNEISKELLGYLEIELPLSEMDHALNQTLLKYFLIVVIFIFCFTVTLLWFAHQRIRIPLSRIMHASQEVRQGNMNLRVDISPSDLNDIKQVEEAFNKMLESIEDSNRELHQWSHDLEKKVLEKTEDLERTQSEIFHFERLASLGRLSSSVAHEINNPLAGILTYAKLVSRMLQNPELTEGSQQKILKHLDMIQSESTRCGNIVKGLLNFSREQSSEFSYLSLNTVLIETEQLIQHSFQISEVRLVSDFSAVRDQIQANRNQIIQACLAVLTNALEAIDNTASGQVTFRSYNPDNEHITVEIQDNGIGISPEDQKHIFEPFFSRKKEMSGIGLGLAVTYGIVEQHQAKVGVDSIPGVGTTIKFTFKLADGRSEDGQ